MSDTARNAWQKSKSRSIQREAHQSFSMRNRTIYLTAASLALSLVLSCNTNPRPDDKNNFKFNPKEIEYTTKFKTYIDALLLFLSNDPSDWHMAKNKIIELNFYLCVDEPDLIKQADSSADARKELGRRGKIIHLISLFMKMDTSSWDKARKELLTLGNDAKALLENTLFNALLYEERRMIWPEIRRQLVQLQAIKSAIETATLFINRAPPYAIFWKDSEGLTQLLLLTLELDQHEFFIKTSSSPNKNVRKSVTYAAAGKDQYMGLLKGYLLKDPEIEVRNTVVIAMGRVKSKEYVKLLIEASKQEQDEFILKDIAYSLGEQRDKDAIARLIELLDNPSYDIVDVVIIALYKITGHKHRTPLEWKSWWKNEKK